MAAHRHGMASVRYQTQTKMDADGGNWKIAKKTANGRPCRICRKSFHLWHQGQIFESFGILVHEKCVTSSPAIYRDPFDGRTGFGCSWREVRAESDRAFRLKCNLCGNLGANNGCETCKRKYHYECGLIRGCVFFYTKTRSKSLCWACKDEIKVEVRDARIQQLFNWAVPERAQPTVTPQLPPRRSQPQQQHARKINKRRTTTIKRDQQTPEPTQNQTVDQPFSLSPAQNEEEGAIGGTDDGTNETIGPPLAPQQRNLPPQSVHSSGQSAIDEQDPSLSPAQDAQGGKDDGTRGARRRPPHVKRIITIDGIFEDVVDNKKYEHQCQQHHSSPSPPPTISPKKEQYQYEETLLSVVPLVKDEEGDVYDEEGAVGGIVCRGSLIPALWCDDGNDLAEKSASDIIDVKEEDVKIETDPVMYIRHMLNTIEIHGSSSEDNDECINFEYLDEE